MRRALVLLAVACLASASPASGGGTPIALVTAESENALLAVDLDSGRIVRRLALPRGPRTVEVGSGKLVAVSTAAGAVSIADSRSLKVIEVIGGFRTPNIAAINGDWAYVTDDRAGVLAVIDLTDARLVRRVAVGAGAHHMAVSPDGRWLWIALGERARTIVILDVARPARPRIVARFDPGFAAHDLAFAPDGRRVWVTGDESSAVTVLDAASRRVAFRVPVGPPPQHVAFNGRFAYLSSGYGSRLVMASVESGRVLKAVSVPYGSFNLVTAGGLVATSSLLRGTLTELTERLRPLRTVKVAPAARDVALTVW